MLLLIQYPLSDSRAFVEGETGRIDRPYWLLPSQYDFLRSFGNVYPRKVGGIYQHICESYFCKGGRGLRLAPCPKKSALYYHFRVKVQFRRFYFDGKAVGKYEIGFILPPDIWTRVSPSEIIDRILALPIITPNSAGGKPQTTTLARAGQSLALEYLLSTTKHAEELLSRDEGDASALSVKEVLQQLNIQRWWVEPGLCSLFLVRNRSERHVQIDYGTGVTFRDENNLPVLTHRLISHSGLRLSLWSMDEIPAHVSNYQTRQRAARELRIALLRVHAERECLRNILVQIERGKLKIERAAPTSDLLQSYLNDTTGQLLDTGAGNSIPILAIANKLDSAVNPGVRDGIRRVLEGIRPAVFAKVERVLDAEAKAIAGIKYLNGNQFKQLHSAMLDAFSRSELEIMVRTSLNKSLEHIVKDASLRSQVHELIVWADDEGQIQKLISGALEARPKNKELQRIGSEILEALSTMES